MTQEFKKRDYQKGSTLLIADDVQRDINFMKRTLKEYHYTNILTFQNPWDAIEVLETGVGDILLVNMENRLMEALDTVKRVKKTPQTGNIPVILTSYDCRPENVIAARKAGADGIIVKPLSEKGIISQLNRSVTFMTTSLLRELKMKLDGILTKGLDLNAEHKEKAFLLTPYCELLYFTIFGFPWFIGGYLELSKIFFEINQDKRAVGLLKKALAVKPGDPGPLEALTNYFAETGLHEKSMFYAKQYAEAAQSADAFGKLAEQLLKCGELDKAIMAINSAISLQESKKRMRITPEEHSLNLNIRGLIHKELGEEKKDNHIIGMALNDFNKAIELNPSLISAQYNLMLTYRKLGDTRMAIEVLDRLKKMEPDDPESWLLIAEAYFSENDPAKTYFAIKKALSIRKNSIRFNIRVSELLFKYNILEKAKEMLLELIKADPENASLYNRLGLISRREGEPEDAIKWYKTGLSHSPKDAVIWFNLAKAFFEHGEIKPGTEALKKAKELDTELDINWQNVFKNNILSPKDNTGT